MQEVAAYRHETVHWFHVFPKLGEQHKSTFLTDVECVKRDKQFVTVTTKSTFLVRSVSAMIPLRRSALQIHTLHIPLQITIQ